MNGRRAAELALLLLLLLAGIALLAWARQGASGPREFDSDVAPLPTGEPQVGGTGPALSQWALLLTNELGEPVHSMALWDASSRFLGATDREGRVAVFHRHAFDAEAVPIRAFQTGITPPTTQYRCAAIALPLAAGAQGAQAEDALRVTLDGAGITYAYILVEEVRRHTPQPRLSRADAGPWTSSGGRKPQGAAGGAAGGTAGGACHVQRAAVLTEGRQRRRHEERLVVTTPARLPALVPLLAGGAPAVTLTYSIVGAGRPLPIVGSTGQPPTIDFATAWGPPLGSAAAAEGQIALAMAKLRDLLRELFPAATITIQALGYEPEDAPPLDATYPIHPDRRRIGDIRIAAARLRGDMNSTLAFTYTPDPTLPAAGEAGLGSDIVVNAAMPWASDAAAASSGAGFSLALVILHELLHAIGVAHHPSLRALMGVATEPGASLQQRFPPGRPMVQGAPAAAAALRLLYSTAVPPTLAQWVRGTCSALPAP